jgi:hypothetical protein
VIGAKSYVLFYVVTAVTSMVSPSVHLFGADRTNHLPFFGCKSDASYSDSVHLEIFSEKVAKYKSKKYTDKKRAA